MRSVNRTDNAAVPIVHWRAYGHIVAMFTVWLLGSVGLAQDELATRFRVSFEAPAAVAWQGVLSVDDGELQRLQPMSLEPAAAAGTSLQGGRVRIHHRTPTKRDVFDVTARRRAGAQLTLKLLDADGEPLGRAVIDLNEAMIGPQSSRLGETGAIFGVTRLEVDRLRVESDRRSLIFEPDETFDFTVLADPVGTTLGEPYEVTATLSRGRSGDEVWRSETVRREPSADGPARVPVSLPLPTDDGVYRVTVRASRPSGFLSRFPTGTITPALAERTFQVAVLDPQTRPPKPGNWTETYAFDPRTQTWADRVPDWMRWRRLPWFATGPLSSETDQATISPSPATGDAHWRAYPLPIAEPGSTYAVEVETLGEPGSSLTVTVLEPDALGDLRPVSGVVTHTVPSWNRSGKRPAARLIVRPRTTSPLLVLANPNEDSTAKLGRIRLLKSAGVASPLAPGKERLVALDFADADLPHLIGASHVRSGIGRFEQADLLTYWETAHAMADRVEFAGANTAVVPVNGRGAAIYPSHHWSSPAHDLAVWEHGVADLPRRELLTLLVQEFDRRGLRLVPAVRFDAPIASLESKGEASPYNGASHAVAAARIAVVEELLTACGDSPAIAEIAIRGSDKGWALLGNPTSAADLPRSTQQLQSSYQQLSKVVEQRLGIAKPLVVLPVELARGRTLRRALEPRLGTTNSLASGVVAEQGLTAIHDSGIRVAAPFATARDGNGTNAAIFAAFRRAVPGDGSTVSLQGDRQRVRLIDSSQRLRRGGNASAGEIRLLATIASAEVEASLTTTAETASLVIIDGPRTAGWVDPASAQRWALLTQLPVVTDAEQDGLTAPSDEDLVTRSLDTSDGGSITIVTNHSAWDRSAHVTIETPQRLRGGRTLADNTPVAEQWYDAGRHMMDVELGAYETVAWQFNAPGVRIDGVRVEPALAARRELAEALDDLQSRDTTQRREFSQLANPSFERNPSNSDERLAGWRFGPGVAATEDAAADGATSITMRSIGKRTATLASDPFPFPTTGQLVLGLQVAATDSSSQANLKIELEEVDGPYRKAALLQANQLTPDPNDSENPWLPVVFPVDDLPLEERGELRLRFTLSGPGEVHIDDLRLEDLILPLDGYEAIDLRSERFAVVRLLTAAEKALQEGRLEACREQIESYWARFLVDNFPRRDEPTVIAETDEKADPTDEVPEATPSLSERLRGYLPRWWR